MNTTIRLTKAEQMLKERQKNDKRYKGGLDIKVKGEIYQDHENLRKTSAFLDGRQYLFNHGLR